MSDYGAKELANAFRPAVERAGLRLVVESPGRLEADTRVKCLPQDRSGRRVEDAESLDTGVSAS